MRTTLPCLLAIVLAGAAHAAGGPPVGVYGCYDATLNFRGQLSITPAPFVMFGLIDGSTYADYDGHQGHYRWDPSSGLITMTDGSRQGWRYHTTGDWSFRMIDNKTGAEAYTCPLDAGKNPSKGPW